MTLTVVDGCMDECQLGRLRARRSLVGTYLTEVAKALNLLPLPFNLTKVSSMFWLLGAC